MGLDAQLAKTCITSGLVGFVASAVAAAEHGEGEVVGEDGLAAEIVAAPHEEEGGCGGHRWQAR